MKNFFMLSFISLSAFAQGAQNQEQVASFFPANSQQFAPWLIIIGFSLASYFAGNAIARKAGFPEAKAGICFIPLIGPFIFLWSMAFEEWPIHQELHLPEDESNE